MTRRQESKNIPDIFTDERVSVWMEEHKAELREYVSGQRLLYQSLMIGFVVGLAAHVGGYVLLSQMPREPLGLFADLLHALGWSLWTGVVVTLFIQVIPAVKQRQVKQALEAYEALKREKTRASGNH